MPALLPPCRIAIRADASVNIGTGHVRRCVSLAVALRSAGAEVRLLSRDLGLNIRALVRSDLSIDLLDAPPGTSCSMGDGPAHIAWAGVTQAEDVTDVLSVFSQADWRPDIVIVDHYAFDAEWHEAVRAATGARMVAIDDLGDRALAADFIIDHNWHSDHRAKYESRMLREARLLTGPSFALLDPAYEAAPRNTARSEVRSIGIFLGGSDAHNVAERVLDAVEAIDFLGEVELVSTSANPNLARLDNRTAGHRTKLTLDQPNLAGFFARHDLHIGAGGGATWERFCIGAPSILLSFALNHDRVLEPLRALGCASVLPMGWDDDDLAQSIRDMVLAPALRASFSLNGQALVDGRGCHRVSAHLMAAP